MITKNRILKLAIAVLLVIGFATASPAATIDFNALEHGRIVNTQYQASNGVTISAKNIGGGPDIAAAFDSTRTGTRDSDLEDPWKGGNLAGNTNLGNLLIIAENNRDATNDGILDFPDDEGSRPAGSLYFDFDAAISSFGFDLVDVEGPVEYGRNSGYVAMFYLGGNALGQVGFGELVDSNSAFYDPTVVFGDNFANRIQPVLASDFGATGFDRVEINFGGSAAIDNITYATVPEPATAFLLGVGLLGLSGIARRRFRG